MDDITWLSSKMENLEEMLDYADNFYQNTNIKVNKKKSRLLWKNADGREEIDLKFGNTTVKTKLIKNSDSIRILGVWMSLERRSKYVYEQSLQDIQDITAILKTKAITDKQLTYIINICIMSKFEYRTNLTILSKNQCEIINKYIRACFKNKIGFQKTAPNYIFENSSTYDIEDIYNRQLKAKTSQLMRQLNDKGLLGILSRVMLCKIQEKFFMPKSSLFEWNMTWSYKLDNNLISATLALIYDNRITIDNEQVK